MPCFEQKVDKGLSWRGQQLSYLILTTPRTGSYLLCDLLRQSGVAGHPDEYFSPEHQARVTQGLDVSTATYVTELCRITWDTYGGIFGAKIMWRQLSTYLLPQLRKNSGTSAHGDLAVLSEYFPNLKIIRLSRKDRPRQALSYTRALQTGTWLSTTKAPPQPSCSAKEAGSEDLQLMFDLEKAIDADEAAISTFLNEPHTPSIHLFYEDIAVNPIGVLQEALRFLNCIPATQLSHLQPECTKQANPQSDRWLEQYSSYKRTRAA